MPPSHAATEIVLTRILPEDGGALCSLPRVHDRASKPDDNAGASRLAFRRDGNARTAMADNELKPIRRVVTGNDAQGRSCVLFDSAAPNVNTQGSARMTDMWVYHCVPAPVVGDS